jgi:5'-3' exonuclease
MARTHLVDALPYVFRAYHSLPPTMTDPEGQPVNAVHGFGTFLTRLWAEERVTHLAVLFDESLTTSFRNEIHPGYKGSREEAPPALMAQVQACRDLAEALGAPTFSSDTLEADDLIGILATRLEREGHQVVVVTSDKDLAQLVTERVSIYDFAKGRRLGPAEVRESLGVAPGQVSDLLALAGDPVDDIPGVRGVGRKTAAALLGHFPTVAALYERLDEVAGLPLRGARTLAARLAAGREQAFTSLELARVVRDASRDARLDVPLASLELAGADRERLTALCERLGLRGLPARVPRWR